MSGSVNTPCRGRGCGPNNNVCVHERAAHSINVAADIAGAGDKVASLVLCWAVSSMAGRLLAAHEISTRTYLDFRG